MLNHLASGCAAEVAAGTLFTPMEVIKNRLQTQKTQSAASMARQIWKTEGIPGFFRGYWMGLAVFVPHTMTYFAAYEECKMAYARYFYDKNSRSEDTDAAHLPLNAYLLCSGVASAIGITLSTPLDIVKTRWQISAAEQGAEFRQGPLVIVKHMWQREGKWRAFTRGLVARIAWGIPTTAISMTVFEALKDWRSNKRQEQQQIDYIEKTRVAGLIQYKMRFIYILEKKFITMVYKRKRGRVKGLEKGGNSQCD